MITATKRQSIQTPKIEFSASKGWPKGVFSRLDADETPPDGLKTTENTMLFQTGTIGPRPGLKLYGVQPTGTVLGQIYEFVKLNGTTPETWMIWMENRSGVGTVIVSKDGGTHTVVTGKTYSSTAKAHFEQVAGKVLITNGSDNLSYMDITTLAITGFSSLTTPTPPTLTGSAALTSSPTITLRYRISAANQGETAASTATTIQVNKLREVWNGTTETVTVTGTRVTGAQRYNIYVGDQAGFEYYLDSVADPGGAGTTFTYTDTGAVATTSTRLAPAGDSTAGPKTTRCTNIRGQVFMTGDIDNPGRIWFGSTIGGAALDFSSYNGGGYVEPNPGGKDVPAIVKPFRDGKGTPTAVCFSKGTNGNGKRYLLQPQTTTLGETVISFLGVQEDNGQDGTDSPDGVVMINDSAIYPSRSKFNSTTTKASIQNILSTSANSDNIAPDVSNLSSKDMANCVGLAVDQLVMWALPVGTPSNGQLWTLDLRQQGAWMKPWYIPVDWMLQYADNASGKTKTLILSNNQICELDPATTTNDLGVTFSTNVGSGAIKFSKDGLNTVSVIDVTFVLLRPQGTINMGVTCDTEDGLVNFNEPLNETASQGMSGWGSYGWSEATWGSLPVGGSDLAVESNKTRKRFTIEIDEECDSVTWSIGTNEPGANFQLAEVLIRYVDIGFVERDN
jgi:hypothetical protein